MAHKERRILEHMIDAKDDVLAMMDAEKQQIEETRGTIWKPVFVQLRVGAKKNGQPSTVGQKAVIRALWPLNEALLMTVHTKFSNSENKYVINSVCAQEIGKPCAVCEQSKTDGDIKTQKSLMLPVHLYAMKDQFEINGDWFVLKYTDKETNQEVPVRGLRILELQNSGAIEPVFRSIRKIHSGDPDEDVKPRDIRSLDLVLECHGTQKKKSIAVEKKDPTTMHPEIRASIPGRDVIWDMVLEARPPQVNGKGASTQTASAPLQGVAPVVKEQDESIPDF